MARDEPPEGERRISDSFNIRNSGGTNGRPKDHHRPERARNGYSGEITLPAYKGPHEETFGETVKHFFEVLFSFFKGIWTQDFADFDLLSSVYFPAQPESKGQKTAGADGQQHRTEILPRIKSEPETTTGSVLPRVSEPRPSTPSQPKLEEKFNSSTAPGTTQQPSAGTVPLATTPGPTTADTSRTTPEKTQEPRTQETSETKPREQTAIEKSVQTMREMRENRNDPRWKLPLWKLKDELTQNIPLPDNFNEMIQRVLHLEGGGKVNEHEPNGGISKYGINSKFNPEVDVRNLTEKQAIKILREKYWEKIQWPGGGVSKMSQAVQFIALDTAVNSQTYANQLLRDSYKKAGGDVRKMPEIMLEMREKRFESLVKEKPKKFEGQIEGWKNRMNALRELVRNYAMTVPTEELVAKLQILRPVDIKRFPTSSDFGEREDPIHGGHGHHHGTDYRTPAGTPLSAQIEGQVFKVATYNGYGKTLIVSHGDGLLFQVYAHLDKVMVKKDQPVHVGDKMALTGNTGRTTGPHLHHELWIREGNKFYVINEMDAISKNLNDPAVRKELIERAHMVEPALFKDAEFRKAALELHGKKPAGEDGTLVAAAPGIPPP